MMRRLMSLAILGIASASHAWWDMGHMLVARIARSGLKPEVQREVDRLLQINPTTKADDMVSAACWADDVRPDRRETANWHFINIHFRTDGKETSNKPLDENVVWAIAKQSEILKDKGKGDAARADALRYILHFVGDVHQPLHSVARDSDLHPDGDRGGNDFKLLPADLFLDMERPPQNLHALWDAAGGLYRSMDRPLTLQGKQYVDALANLITLWMPESSLQEASDLKPDDWVQESLKIAESFAYTAPENGKPDIVYLLECQRVSAKRIALAGYRLGHLLNELLSAN